MTAEKRRVYGPVLSRRLGHSLGVDLVPFKVCSFNCVYCQLGRTTSLTTARAEHTPVKEIAEEVAAALATGSPPDYVTLAGSGEPTLHAKLDEIVRAIKDITDRPVAVLTNGSLLFKTDVRRACALADVVMPTLAAHDEAGYQRVHRPCAGLTLARHVSGLVALRAEHQTSTWLELFLLEGINASDADRAAFAELLDRIAPDRIQINTAVRPTSEPGALAVEPGKLRQWADALGPHAEVIAEPPAEAAGGSSATESDVLALCRRRPCTLDQIAQALDLHRNEVVKYVTSLLATGAIHSQWQDGREYLVASSTGQPSP